MHCEACDILAAFKIEARIWLLIILQLLRICTNTTMPCNYILLLYLCMYLLESVLLKIRCTINCTKSYKNYSTTTVVTSKQTSTKRMNYFDLLLLYITRILLWCCLIEVLSNKWGFEEGYLPVYQHMLFQ